MVSVQSKIYIHRLGAHARPSPMTSRPLPSFERGLPCFLDVSHCHMSSISFDQAWLLLIKIKSKTIMICVVKRVEV
jgi:hypothetical protein